MLKYMATQIGPAWFQELSSSQIAAANLIFSAVSFDSDEVQLERCRNALSAIGLDPLPKKFDLLTAIQFSRNNDLAFLWFLYDSVYNSCDDIASKKHFPLNERLILSSICHLDMMTTMRELDRVLPKPAVKPKPQQSFSTPRKAIKYATPYDEPVPKPKPQQDRFYEPPQRQHPKFEIYRNYKNPCYIIQNETNRWYAQEKLLPSESRNIAKAIVCEQINKVADQKFDREKVLNGLCEKHRVEATKFNQIMMKVLNDPMNIHSDENLKDCDPFERGIIYGIQLELAKTEKEFHDVAEKYQKQVIVKTMLRQIVENAADLKFIHLCEKCEKCILSKKLYRDIVKVNEQEEVSIEPTDEIPQPKDKNQIKFFRRSSISSPFEFDYEKIFATSFLNDCGVVKNSINIALELDKNLTEDNAITVCLQDMWQLELKLWNEKRQKELEENQQRVVADCDKIGKSKQKVFNLLSRGITLMRKNPKFVLASLPDAHRLPILREWILHRFGFRYSLKDNEEKWKQNKFYRDRLEAAGIVPRLEVPSLKMFGIKKPRPDMSYDVALKHAKKVTENLRKSFLRSFSQFIQNFHH